MFSPKPVKNFFFIFFCLCWNGNYLAMTLPGSMHESPYGFSIEVGARVAWILLGVSLFVYWLFQNYEKSSPRSILSLLDKFWEQLPQKMFFCLFLLTGFSFILIGVYHQVYREPFSSAFTVFAVLLISSLGVQTQILNLRFFLQSVIWGTFPYVYLSLYLKLTGTTSFLGFKQEDYFVNTEYSWGLFTGANAFGVILMVLVLATLSRVFLLWGKAQRKNIAFLSIHLSVLFYLLYYTYHRSALLALFCALFVFLFFHLKQRYKWLFVAGIFIMMIGVFNYSPSKQSGLTKWEKVLVASSQMLKGNFDSNNWDTLTTRRSALWRESLQSIQKHPLLGTGWKRMAFALYQSIPDEIDNYAPLINRKRHVRDAHSSLLHIAEIYGLPVLILILLFHYFAIYPLSLHLENQWVLFLLGTIAFYALVNGGLFATLQFYSVFYCFLLSLFAYTKGSPTQK